MNVKHLCHHIPKKPNSIIHASVCMTCTCMYLCECRRFSSITHDTVYRPLFVCIVHRLHLGTGSDPYTRQYQFGSGGVRSRKLHSLSTTIHIRQQQNPKIKEKRELKQPNERKKNTRKKEKSIKECVSLVCVRAAEKKTSNRSSVWNKVAYIRSVDTEFTREK